MNGGRNMRRSRISLFVLACSLAVTSLLEVPSFAAGSGYTAQILPLIPAGINDSGVIAGTVGLNAASYQNGVITLLPHANGVVGLYEADAINNDGAIAGNVVNGPGMFWRK